MKIDLLVFFGCVLSFHLIVESDCIKRDGSFWIFADALQKGLYCVSSSNDEAYHISVPRIFNPVAVHYNEVNEKLYWSDVTIKEIRSTSVDKPDDMLILSLNNKSIPDGLAVDGISNLLFYSDAGNHLIAVLELDGLSSANVITEDCDQPRAIVLDIQNGKMYWTDWGKVPKIETANYDGSDRKAIIKARILWPNALSIDFSDNWMYWGDAGTHNIERAKLDGSQRQTIFNDPKAHLFSLIVDSNVLYYTDWQHRSLMRVNIDGSGKKAVGKPLFSRLDGLTQLKAKPRSLDKNACSKRKGDCSHICLPRPGGKRICMCPSGFTLQNDTLCIATCSALPPESHTATPIECTTDTVRIGMVCNVKCKEGFIGENVTLECGQDGQWNNTIQECTDVQAPVIHNCPLFFGHVITTGKGEDSVSVYWGEINATDNSGIKPKVIEFVMSGTRFREGVHTVTILAVDSKGLFEVCQFTFIILVPRCGSGSIPEHSYITSSLCQDHYGATCNVSCLPGYRFPNNTKIAEIECGLDKSNKTEWTVGEISCEPIVCPPIILPDVSVTGCDDPFFVGTLCEQKCVSGFEKAHGTDVRVCKSDGKWSGQDIVCREKSKVCYELSHLPNVMVSGCTSPFVVGSVCEQECAAGYGKIQGSGIRACRVDGTWSGHDLVCTTQVIEHNNNNWFAIIIAAAVVFVSVVMMFCGMLIYLNRTSAPSAPRTNNRFTESVRYGSDEVDDRQ